MHAQRVHSACPVSVQLQVLQSSVAGKVLPGRYSLPSYAQNTPPSVFGPPPLPVVVPVPVPVVDVPAVVAVPPPTPPSGLPVRGALGVPRSTLSPQAPRRRRIQVPRRSVFMLG